MSVQFPHGPAVLSDTVLPKRISVFGHEKNPTAPAQVILTVRRERRCNKQLTSRWIRNKTLVCCSRWILYNDFSPAWGLLACGFEHCICLGQQCWDNLERKLMYFHMWLLWKELPSLQTMESSWLFCWNLSSWAGGGWVQVRSSAL